MKSPKVSVFVLTLNEEVNLARCLDSLSWCDDVVVVDSFSTDRTVDIANQYGARVVQRKFDTWAEHQNWIHENITFKYDWVYYSDADEVVTPELRDEMIGVAHSTSEPVAYRVRYKNYFMGKWLKYSGGYPIWVLRFFRPKYVRWERVVNPRPIVSGVESKLKEHFLHYSFNKGLTAWFSKHNSYSSGEAEEMVRFCDAGNFSIFSLFSIDSATRRRGLKELSFLLPARGVLRFFYQYFICLGFLDGRAGFHWCVMNGIYEYMISLKAMEIRLKQSGKSV